MSPWTVWMENLARGLAEVAMPGLMAQSSLEKYLLAGIDRVHASVAKAQKPAERAKALAKGLAMPSALMRAHVRDRVRHLPEISDPGQKEALGAYLCHVMSQARHRAASLHSPLGRKAATPLTLEEPANLLDLLPLRQPAHGPGQEVGGFRLKRFRFGTATTEYWKATMVNKGDVVSLAIIRNKKAREAFTGIADRLNHFRHLVHPAIHRLLAHHQDENQSYIAWAYERAVPLPAVSELWEAQEGRIDAGRVGRWIRRIARSLAFLHGRSRPEGHGGLMPSNLALARHGRGWKVHLAEIGWADFEAAHLIKVRNLAAMKVARRMYEIRGGWPAHYASPARLDGSPPVPADDVFALGVVWYQMVMGRWDLPAPKGLDWVDKALDRGLPVEHGKLLSRCLQTDISKRPADAPALLALLETLKLGKGN